MAQIVTLSKAEMSMCIQGVQQMDWDYIGAGAESKALLDKLKAAYVREHEQELKEDDR